MGAIDRGAIIGRDAAIGAGAGATGAEAAAATVLCSSTIARAFLSATLSITSTVPFAGETLSLSDGAGLRTGAIFCRAATKAAAALRVVTVLVAACVVPVALATEPVSTDAASAFALGAAGFCAAGLVAGFAAMAGFVTAGLEETGLSDFAETVDVLRAAGAEALGAALTGAFVATGVLVVCVLVVCVLDAFVVIFFSSVAVLGLACATVLFRDAEVGRVDACALDLAAFFAIGIVLVEFRDLVDVLVAITVLVGLVAVLTEVLTRDGFVTAVRLLDDGRLAGSFAEVVLRGTMVLPL